MNAVIDLKSKLAGMTALCTANPYIKLSIGGGVYGADKRKVKQISDRDNAQIGELSPEFLSVFELDAEFPQDSKLEVAIWDKASVAYSDQLIGKTTIELENRRCSNLLNLNRIACQIENEKIGQKIKKLKALLPKGKKGAQNDNKEELEEQISVLTQRKQQIMQMAAKIKGFDTLVEPVEFREL